MKLYGRGEEGGSQLQITAEVPFQLSLDDHTITAPVFVQPDSDIPCLLGMNVIPHLGIRLLRSNGSPMLEVVEKADSGTLGVEVPTIGQIEVHLAESACIPGRKGMVLAIRTESESLCESDCFLFEPNQESLSSLGLTSFECLLETSDTIMIPLENHLSVAIDVDSSYPIGTLTLVSAKDVDSSTHSPEDSPQPEVCIS